VEYIECTIQLYVYISQDTQRVYQRYNNLIFTVQSHLSLVVLAQNRRPEPRPKGKRSVAFSLIPHTLPLFILPQEGGVPTSSPWTNTESKCPSAPSLTYCARFILFPLPLPRVSPLCTHSVYTPTALFDTLHLRTEKRYRIACTLRPLPSSSTYFR